MPKSLDPTQRRLGEDPALLLARELVRAHGLAPSEDSAELALAKLAYTAALRGSTCEEIDRAAARGVDEAFCAKKGKAGSAPLVLRGDKLYLAKLDLLEEKLAKLIQARLAATAESWDPESAWLPQPRPGKPQTCGDQQAAVRLSCKSPFMILTGGPGTGKTTTAACIVGALVSKLGIPLSSIRLCAPTGRATNRLDMGIRGGDQGNVLTRNAESLGVKSEEDFRTGLPKALTVHKLVRNPELLANARLVVVDECSMIDIYLFVRLLEAVPKEARLLLIGDPQQLPSVDTGSVLEDMCLAKALEPRTAHLAEQFRAGGEARKWADYALAVVEGRSAEPPGKFEGSDPRAVIDASLADFKAIKERAEKIGKESARGSAATQELLEACASLRILCSHRRGPKGSVHVSRLVRQKLGLKSEDQAGGLVMVTRNDHKVTNLSNGEVGVVVNDGLVWFPDKPLPIPFSQLPPNEPAFATTIHKAQGSEYKRVYLLLGESGETEAAEAGEEFINRQLIFTGLTRAIESVRVFGSEEGLKTALGNPAARASGLAERLAETGEKKGQTRKTS